MSSTSAAAPRRRADAERNHARLLEAARRVFADRGMDASLDEIARVADLGNATLYRHFPDRAVLLEAVFTDAVRELVAATESALRVPDPWQALRGHLLHLCEMQSRDRTMADLITARISGAPELEELRGRMFDGLLRLIDRAQAAGVLRSDFHHTDVVLLLMANAGLLERSGSSAPDAWRRLVDFVLDGLQPGPGEVTCAPDEVGILASMDETAVRHGCAPSPARVAEDATRGPEAVS